MKEIIEILKIIKKDKDFKDTFNNLLKGFQLKNKNIKSIKDLQRYTHLFSKTEINHLKDLLIFLEDELKKYKNNTKKLKNKYQIKKFEEHIDIKLQRLDKRLNLAFHAFYSKLSINEKFGMITVYNKKTNSIQAQSTDMKQIKKIISKTIKNHTQYFKLNKKHIVTTEMDKNFHLHLHYYIFIYNSNNIEKEFIKLKQKINNALLQQGFEDINVNIKTMKKNNTYGKAGNYISTSNNIQNKMTKNQIFNRYYLYYIIKNFNGHFLNYSQLKISFNKLKSLFKVFYKFHLYSNNFKLNYTQLYDIAIGKNEKYTNYKIVLDPDLVDKNTINSFNKIEITFKEFFNNLEVITQKINLLNKKIDLKNKYIENIFLKEKRFKFTDCINYIFIY